MQYKTIVLEMVEEQYPALHQQLRASRTLLETLNRCAADLKACHEHWMRSLEQTRPGSDPRQISSEALELAIMDLQEALRLTSPPGGATTEPLSLDDAMAYLRRRAPAE